MEFIDEAALRQQAFDACSQLPPLPKTAQELLLDPSDPNSDADDESEASGVLGDGDSVAYLSEGDLCLTGRGRRVKELYQQGMEEENGMEIGDGKEGTTIAGMVRMGRGEQGSLEL